MTSSPRKALVGNFSQRLGAIRAWGLLHAAARRFDDLPVSPSSLGDHLWDRHLERQHQRALGDPTWQDIEDRRERKEDGSAIFISRDLDLDFSHWETQRRRETELTPDPFWIPAARRARSLRLDALTTALEFSLQRLRQGWSDKDIWSLDAHLCSNLAVQLVRLAEISHGYPERYGSFEAWEETLRHHARVFATQGHLDPASEDLLLHWHEVASTEGSSSEEAQVARDRMDKNEEDAEALLQKSFQWLADNHADLWA